MNLGWASDGAVENFPISTELLAEKSVPETKVAHDDGMLTVRINESTKENPYVLVSEIPEKILAIPQR